MKKKIIITLLFLLTVSGLNCSIFKTITNLSRLQFRIGSAVDFRLAGISLAGKRSIKDFSSFEVLKLSSAFVRNSLPLTFTLNIEARNPNDGTGGYPRTNAAVISFPWKLFVDDKETVTGNLGSEVIVPGTGEASTIPLTVNLDLVRFFKNKDYEGIINLALNLARLGNSPSKLTLYAQPTVKTEIGNITYPDEIKIVNLEYSQ